MAQAKVTNEAFDDLLHRLIHSTRRPTDDESKARVKKTVKELADACEREPSRWKLFTLALIQKRYHILSPQAKEIKANRGGNLIAGDGERSIFYTAAKVLFEESSQNSNESAAMALRALCRVACLAGGTRDICKLIVDFVDFVLRNKLRRNRENTTILYGSESLSQLVALGLQQLQPMHESLNILFQIAADLLDTDLEIVRTSSDKLTSTIHVFIPHRARGSKRNTKQKKSRHSQPRTPHRVPDRQLANAVAEILIWSKLSRMTEQTKFTSMFEDLLNAASDSNRDATKRNLHAMQTMIRKHRQQLNWYARDRGQMLSNLYDLNPESLNISKTKRGKTGDVAALTKMAKKKKDTQILRLINLRFSDPSKATKFGSIHELIVSWVNAPEDVSKEVLSKEVAMLEREIFVAKVRATLSYFRSTIKRIKKDVLIASLDKSKANHVAAILVAAAISEISLDDQKAESMEDERVRLLVKGESKSIISFDHVFALLDEVISDLTKNQVDAPSFMSGNIATTKAILNLIDRHVKKSEGLLLFSSGDICMPLDKLEELIAKGSNIHCHDADILGERLTREGAKKGDITISLAWDTKDDLDLHVHIPTGEHLFFGNRTSRDKLCELDVDMNAGFSLSKEPVENVIAGDLATRKEAPHGHYKVVIQNFCYHETKPGGSIPFRVIIDKNGKKEILADQCTGTKESSNVTISSFDYHGRTIPFPISEEERTAFGTSNMVNLTASTGQTIDSIGQLVQTLAKLEHLDQVREIVNNDRPSEDSRPLVANHGTLEVTSRDLLGILLSKLPPTFHEIVGQEFGGGPTLAEECAKQLSIRMIAEQIPTSELQRCGYPQEIIDLVKQIIATTC